MGAAGALFIGLPPARISRCARGCTVRARARWMRDAWRDPGGYADPFPETLIFRVIRGGKNPMMVCLLMEVSV